MAYSFGLDELTTATNASYLMSLLAGLITGVAVIIIPKEKKLKALVFVIGSLLLMDTVAYFGTEMPINDLVNRMLVTIALSISGIISFLITRFLLKSKTESTS